MKLLSLLRHAAAAMDGQDDHSRSLSVDGQREAVDIATRWKNSGLAAPDLILSSDSLRTRATAAALTTCFPDSKIETTPVLYLAAPDSILDTVIGAPDDCQHIVIVGHNPGIGQLAYDLGGHTHPLISHGFATATLATFECSVDAWQDMSARHITLRSVLTP